MKTDKKIRHDIEFYYFNNNRSLHGLQNINNKYIGYIYQNNRKGFTLSRNHGLSMWIYSLDEFSEHLRLNYL
jgi:hypothetical protein